MHRKLLPFIFFFILTLAPFEATASEQGPSLPTHNDLIINLVDSLGWSFGLPDNPGIEDYIKILNGRRTWRFEIEDIVIPDAKAPLAPKETLSFGPFSNQKWYRAPGREIEVELSFLLPLPGDYVIKAALTKPGYKISINETDLSADGERNFSEVTFGSTTLNAGIQTARLTIPSRGGIDYLLLEAPPAPAIMPVAGWNFEKTVEASELANVIVQVLNLDSHLQPAGSEISFEAEEAPTPKGSVCCEDRYKGPMKGQWVKTGIEGADYSHLFEIEDEGIYDLYLNVLGTGPVQGLLNGKDYFSMTPKSYFTLIYAGSFNFEKGTNQLDIILPSRAGLDRFILKPRLSAPADYLRLAGLPADATPATDQLDQLMRLIAAIGVNR